MKNTERRTLESKEYKRWFVALHLESEILEIIDEEAKRQKRSRSAQIAYMIESWIKANKDKLSS